MSDTSTRPSRPPPDGASPLPTGSADSSSASAQRGIDSLGFVMDVPVELTVVIGRKSMKIGEILRLGPGSVLELDKASGEPLDIFANGRLIARGEAVVVGERYGVRLTEVLVMDELSNRRGSS
ncbi:MAG TPA: flagellar motor switch protein FliN [Polyangiaceae bacterium]|jgi:flagellar motor switch protein FliN/FliY|nr:flagellar motor switch protein FliN [Polyangiaceae bacterium]